MTTNKKYPAIIHKNNTLPDGIEIEVSRALVDAVKQSDGPVFHVFIEEEVYEPQFETALEMRNKVKEIREEEHIIETEEDAPIGNIQFAITNDAKFTCLTCNSTYKSLLNLGRHYEEKHLK